MFAEAIRFYQKAADVAEILEEQHRMAQENSPDVQMDTRYLRSGIQGPTDRRHDGGPNWDSRHFMQESGAGYP